MPITADIVPRPQTCRRLFGPVDHEEVKAQLKEQNRVLDSEYKQKYNFDFVQEKPLDVEGRFEWTKVTNIPKAYSMTHLDYVSTRLSRRDSQSSPGHQGDISSPLSSPSRVPDAHQPPRSYTPEPASTARSLSALSVDSKSSQTDFSTGPTDAEAAGSSNSGTSESMECPTTPERCHTPPGKRKQQSLITDFYQSAKRRRVSTKDKDV